VRQKYVIIVFKRCGIRVISRSIPIIMGLKQKIQEYHNMGFCIRLNAELNIGMYLEEKVRKANI